MYQIYIYNIFNEKKYSGFLVGEGRGGARFLVGRCFLWKLKRVAVPLQGLLNIIFVFLSNFLGGEGPGGGVQLV